MSDEFDDHVEYPRPAPARRPAAAPSQRRARIVARLYRSLGADARARMLGCLLRPLGTLALSAVAGGAFAGMAVGRARDAELETLAQVGGAQVFELASFVEQCSPGAFQSLAALLSDGPMGAAAFTAALTVLLVRLSADD